MTEDFLPDTNETPTPPVSANTPTEPLPERERLKIILISSPRVVKSTIRTLYTKGFAEVTEWSPLQPTSNPNEVISVLSRNITIHG